MIGVFDSGSGGLSVLKAIRARMPSADVLYFGDIKNAPYGERTPEELSALTVRAMQYLQSRGADSIVSACNSVSASLAVSLFDVLDITSDRLIEMVGPTIRHAKEIDGKLALVATPATIRSNVYQHGFRMAGKDVEVIAVPDLAGAIEFGASEEELEQITRRALTDTPAGACDSLVLACTHYPLISHIFSRVLGEAVQLLDPADAVAKRVERQLWPREVGTGQLQFVTTKESLQFRQRVAEFFPESAEAIEVVK